MNVQLYPTPIIHESRIERMTRALAGAGLFDRILIVGTQPGGLPDQQDLDPVRAIRRVPRLAEGGTSFAAKIIKTRSWTERVFRLLAPEPITCVTCHSLAVLPLCVRLARRHGAKLVYEPHELETETGDSRGLRRFMMQRVEARLIRHAHLTIAVNQVIARWYEDSYGLPPVEVVRNIPSPDGEAGTVDLRQKFGVSRSDVLFVYSGGLFRGRRVEQFLRIFQRVTPDRHVVFMGFGALAGAVEEAARHHRNIHLLPSVPPRQVLSHLRGADAGLSGMESLSQSNYYSLPNKLFEYLHAGVGALVPNYPEMAQLVSVTKAGWIVEDDTDEAWLKCIQTLSREAIDAAKIMAREAAPGYTWPNETKRLIEAYRRLGFPRNSPR